MKHEDTFYRDKIRKQKKWDQPWRRRMSLCIAAKATGHDGDRVVICTDKQVSTDLERAETQHKAKIIAPNLMALFAGTIADAHELIGIYSGYLGENPLDWKDINVLDSLKIPAQLLRQRRIEEHVQSQLGISYDRFLKKGRAELDPDIHRAISMGISEVAVNVAMVICGFTSSKYASVFELNGTELREQTNFACIGTGAMAAHHCLFRRRQESTTPLVQSLYNVWEAKRFGELAPTVGRETDMLVLEPGFGPHESEGCVKEVTDEGQDFLAKLYKRYGPREVSSKLELPKDMYYDPSVYTES